MGSRLVRIGQIHTTYSIIKNFNYMLTDIKDPSISSAYNNLFLLFCYNQFEELASPALASSILKPEHCLEIQDLKEEIYSKLDDDALVLAEGLQFSDNMLLSAISLDNGEPYQNLYDWARKFGRLNKTHGDAHMSIIRNWLPYFREREGFLSEEEKRMRDKL